VIGLALAIPGTAWGHAERSASTPEAGAKLDEIPSSLHVEFTEPPTSDAVVEVLDGCGNDVVASYDVEGTAIDARLSGGVPGRWNVRLRVVSGLDGHETNDRFGFAVKGERDCAAPRPSPTGTQPGPGALAGDAPEFPVLPFVIGTAVLAGGALLLRGRRAR
jgi:methionine-rich copper-binding protein CopC